MIHFRYVDLHKLSSEIILCFNNDHIFGFCRPSVFFFWFSYGGGGGDGDVLEYVDGVLIT